MKKISNDSTKQMAGFFYQFCIALEFAYKMQRQDSLFLESYGDISVGQFSGNATQIEVKQYEKDLTDKSENIWKTLKNWIHTDFPLEKFSTLLLLTTQSFGKKSSFQKWNELNVEQKHEILSKIYTSNKSSEESKLQAIMDVVMDSKCKEKLLDILSKFSIITASRDIIKQTDYVKTVYMKGFPDSHRDRVFNSLLGYIINPINWTKKVWEISFDDFDKEVRELTRRFAGETKKFPLRPTTFDNQEIDRFLDKLFVQKIKKISYDGAIKYAIYDYIWANNVILSDFMENSDTPSGNYIDFKDVEEQLFRTHHARAVRNLNGQDIILASQNFYDGKVTEAPTTMQGMENVPIPLRNGILHILCDDSTKELNWKLK